MCCLKTKTKECWYKEKGRGPKEQFIKGINDADTVMEILTELITIKKTNEITSEQVLCWVKRIGPGKQY